MTAHRPGRTSSRLLGVVLAAAVLAAGPARADNAMGYQMLTAEQAAQLPRRGGALGLDVERAQHLTDNGLTFDIMRVKQVRRGSAGARAGFAVGDQLIAVDGRVFPTIAAFAAYIGAMPPGQQITVDYMPAGGGPKQAQRVTLAVGAAGQNAPAASTGMSTGTKIAIGLGAAALLGCYEAGCFSHRSNDAPVNGQQPQPAP